LSASREATAAARFARAMDRSILKAATPRAWVSAASADLPTLLVDHSNCEKKAASTAMALIFAYPEDRALAVALSRLAREELKHFEQVERLMKRLDVPHLRLKPGRYASELGKRIPGSVHLYEPGQLRGAVEAAIDDPALTWLPPGTAVGPTTPAAAATYLAWLRARSDR
jgi:hypothetical protein